jgi:hypothetical protein
MCKSLKFVAGVERSMQNSQEQNFTFDSKTSNPNPPSVPKQIEIWSGRLAMMAFVSTVAVMILNVN